MSVYGLNTVQDCKSALEKLLVLVQTAKDTMTKNDVGRLKSTLRDSYEHGRYKQNQMSKIETSVFFPAVHESYAKAPNLTATTAWKTGLDDVEFYLNYYLRPLSE
jgi:hypothetical protein